MATRPKTGGRQKGTPNKTTQDVREAILAVADGLGGVDGLLSWAQKDETNERIFWSQIYTKVMPTQVKAEVTGPNGGPLQVVRLRMTPAEELPE
jgi:hypothetical protein